MLKCNATLNLLSGITNTLFRTSFFTLLLVFFAYSSFAQVGINTDNSAPDVSAILDIKSTTKGMLAPRMTTAQRTAISSPATGLLVFDIDIASFWFYDGTAWEDLSAVKTSDHIADADADTKIQVEESGDEDKIRFDINGTEFGYMDGTTFHLGAPGNSLFIGTNAGQNDDGSDNRNTFIGIDAGKANISGSKNTANGYQALYKNTTGSFNTAIGKDALYFNTEGRVNTANGHVALYRNTIGDNNTANGHATLYNNITGNNNTANGFKALLYNSTGDNNTALGYQADVSSVDLNNATAIGANALVDASNKIRLGDSLVTVVETEGMYSGMGIQDADADTKIQVEESGDEDKIRFDINGTEFGHMDGKTFHLEALGLSLFIGTNAGQNDDGNNNANTFIGLGAGQANTTGYFNTANGYQALNNNTTGNYNTANGMQALYKNTSGNYNTANGRSALWSNTIGYYNTANGMQALLFNTEGNNNTANGYNALKSNTTGNDNTALGHKADVSSGDLNNATAIGANALVSQDSSLVLGNEAKVGIGTSAPEARLHVVGDVKIVDGNQTAGYVLTSDANGLASWQLTSDGTKINDADNDTKIQVEESGDEDKIRFDIDGIEFGHMDGKTFHLAAGGSLFIGNNAGQNDDGSNNKNTFIGIDAGQANTTGSANTANGYQALYSNIEGQVNTANGYQALYNNIAGSGNTANGYLALRNNISGFANTATGSNALYFNTEGSDNTAIGKMALYKNITGNDNTAIGREALFENNTGDNNAALGFNVLYSNTTGDNNTAIGREALNNNTTGSNNTALGYYADVGSNNLTNATAIGANAEVECSNCLVLGNNVNVGIGTSSPLQKLDVNGNASIDGFTFNVDDVNNRVGIGTATPIYKLEVNGSAAKTGGGLWSATSDRRLKQDIKPYADGLEKVLAIKAVTYRYNEKSGHDTEPEYVGVIAQELQKVAPYMVSSFNKDGEEYLSVDPSAMMYMLINAVQEQQEIIKSLKAENEALKTRNSAFETRLLQLDRAIEQLAARENNSQWTSSKK